MKDVGPEIVSFTAYQYDPTFSVYERQVKVVPHVSPQGECVYVIPKSHTLISPPSDIRKGCVAMFHERTQSWLVIDDHRGEWWLDDAGTPVKIGRLGNPALWKYRPLSEEQVA